MMKSQQVVGSTPTGITNEYLKIKVMKSWKVYYKDKSGDTSKCWTEAETREDAITKIRHEYWDIDEIISCCEMK